MNDPLPIRSSQCLQYLHRDFSNKRDRQAAEPVLLEDFIQVDGKQIEHQTLYKTYQMAPEHKMVLKFNSMMSILLL